MIYIITFIRENILQLKIYEAM